MSVSHRFRWVWPVSIRRQLVVGVALVHLVLMTVFVLALVHRQKTFLLDRAERRVLFQAELLATTSVHPLLSSDLAGLGEILAVLVRDAGDVPDAMVTDPRGRVVAHRQLGEAGDRLDEATIRATVAGAPRARLVARGQHTIHAAAPVMARGRHVGWAWITGNVSAERAQLDDVTRAGLVYTGVAVLIAATRGAGRKLARSVVGQVDGLVVLARSLPVTDIESFSRSVPIVVLADRSNGSRLDYVGADNRGGMRELTAHLLTAHRFRRLAFVGGPPRSPDSQERFAGFRVAMREAGLPVPAQPAADGGFTEAGGARAMRTLLTGGKPPQAVLFGNDEMAVGGLAVLRAAGLRVPSGIAVTGFDDIALSRHVQPSLTTVRQPMRDLGEQAVRVLLARVAEPASRRQSLVLPTQLVVRRPSPPSMGAIDRATSNRRRERSRRKWEQFPNQRAARRSR